MGRQGGAGAPASCRLRPFGRCRPAECRRCGQPGPSLTMALRSRARARRLAPGAVANTPVRTSCPVWAARIQGVVPPATTQIGSASPCIRARAKGASAPTPAYHSITAAPQVSPAPKTSNMIKSPRCTRPEVTASSRAIATEAAEVLPYL